MLKPNRSFAAGCLCGIILTLAGLTLAGFAVFFFFKDWVVDSNAKRLRRPPITAGLKAEYDWQVMGLDGAPFSLKTCEGKTVFLTFWHPDCVPCLAEIPALNALYAQTAPYGVVFLGVALGNEAEIRAAVQQEGIQFPVYLLAGRRPPLYETKVTPAAFIINPQGDVVFKHEGAAQWDDPATAAFLRMQGAP